MKTEKMSFKNIKDVLSRDEMKGIMAGSGGCYNGGCWQADVAWLNGCFSQCYSSSGLNCGCFSCCMGGYCGSRCA